MRKWSEGYKKPQDREKEMLLDIYRCAKSAVEAEKELSKKLATPEKMMAAKIALDFSITVYEGWKNDVEEDAKRKRSLASRGSM